MSYVWVDAIIKNPFTGKSASAKALVDTGATLTVIPRKVADRLALPVIGRSPVQTAKGVESLRLVLELLGSWARRRLQEYLFQMS
jgi:predicted aspartyl protease